jgi:ribonuclease R
MANFSKYKKENKKHKKDRHDPSRNSKSGSKPSAPREHKKTHQNQSLIAVVEKNKKGFAFLNFEKRSEYEDLFVPPRQADQFLHGDRVRVMINSYGEVQDIELIEHRFRELVGRVYYGKIIYERKKTREEIRIIKTPPGSTQSSPIPKVSEVKDGDWVRVKIHVDHHSQESLRRGAPEWLAEVIENYGQTLPASADLQLISAEYNWTEGHSQQSIEEAEKLTLTEEEIQKAIQSGERQDLRSLPLITIDGETARDFDDAVSVERIIENNQLVGYWLWVAIADVSHYVKPGTALDREAFSRGTSVYFPEKAFHMLPRALSENLCSIKPQEPRFVMVAKMRINLSGKRQLTLVSNAVMVSQRRATYLEIEKEKNDSKLSAHFELYRLLKKMREEKGTVDFDLPEAEIRVDAQGEPVSIVNRERLDAHRLIEEFMICANEGVTEWALERESPFLYRTHEEPSGQSLEQFQQIAETLGVHHYFDQHQLHQSIRELILKIRGTATEQVLNQLLLRSMKQAVYTADHGDHFGLASGAYTHFTSPIRRYPDLVVHRQLKQLIQLKGDLSSVDTKKQTEQLTEIADHCSYRERLAAEAERESIKMKQVRLMMKHLGEEFDAKANGLNDNGVFAQVLNPWVEGFIPKDSLTEDQFKYVQQKMCYLGYRTKKVLKIGQLIKIQVVRADLEQRLIEFKLVSELTRATPEFMSDVDTEPKADKKREFKRDFNRENKKDVKGKRSETQRGYHRDTKKGRKKK